MITGVVTEAIGAVSLAATVTGGIEALADPPKGVHWSFYVVVGAAGVGAVVAVAAVIFSQYATMAAGVALSATGLLSGYYIRKMSAYMGLEQYVRKLTETVKKIVSSTKTIQRANVELKRNLTASQELAKIYKATLDGAQKTTQSQIDMIDGVSGQVKASVRALGKAVDIKGQQDNAASLAKQSADLHSVTEGLVQHVASVDEAHEKLSTVSLEIKKDLAAILAANLQIQGGISTLSQLTLPAPAPAIVPIVAAASHGISEADLAKVLSQAGAHQSALDDIISKVQSSKPTIVADVSAFLLALKKTTT